MITKNITQTFNWKHREEDFSIINEKAQLVFKIFGIPFFKKTIDTIREGNYTLDEDLPKKHTIKGFGH